MTGWLVWLPRLAHRSWPGPRGRTALILTLRGWLPASSFDAGAVAALGLAAGHKVSRCAHSDSDHRRMIMDTDGNTIAGMLEEIFDSPMRLTVWP